VLSEFEVTLVVESENMSGDSVVIPIENYEFLLFEGQEIYEDHVLLLEIGGDKEEIELDVVPLRMSIEPPAVASLIDPLVTKVKGPSRIKYKEKTLYTAEEFNRALSESEKARIKWVVRIDGVDTELEEKGTSIEYAIKDREAIGKKIIVMPYFQSPIEKVSAKSTVVEGLHEVVLVVGTEQHSATYGNKMMFPAQAVREVRQNYKSATHISVLVFNDGYNAAELALIESDAVRHNQNLRAIELETVTDLLNYLNQGDDSIDRDQIEVKVIKFFSHGLPSTIDFGMDGAQKAVQKFEKSHVAQLSKDSFHHSPTIYSYACRTGNSSSKKEFDTDKWRSQAKPEESLAQEFAEHLEAKVYAFIKRSLYTSTWNDGGDSDFRENYVEIEDESLDGQYHRPWNWDQALWNKDGGYAPPTAGELPAGLPSEMYLFEKGKTPTPR